MNDPEREAEARRALDRVARDSESVGSSSLARAGKRLGGHFSAADAEGEGEGGTTDPAELWGRRVGRAISVLLGAGLAWWLGAQLGWW
ncbi:hypothetical protein [uncultured Enterovirga sp.]|uniref:hypothetical protein n=1 Tax=uncultured Enterovirga sp. TaxID=2026352 RepID=UPI0035C98C64